MDTPEIGSHAKCIKERKLALIAKGRLRELLAEKGLRIVLSGAVDKTPTHRPLVNIYRTNGEEIGKKLLKEGFARTWSPRHLTGATDSSKDHHQLPKPPGINRRHCFSHQVRRHLEGQLS
ncbi:thermonuclease family protein [Rhizobium ruizarguesonis]|uniref:thermonuclease family protein n=1 Tax=Rhizobium ruizarguesonis TaxID=2081791 RepID=UPI0037C559A5